MDTAHLERLCRLARRHILVSTSAAGSGHPTSSLSAVELMVALMFGGTFRYRVAEPDYHNNDRLIFSKGHASPLFYALWSLAGVLSPEELLTLRSFESPLEGHPTMRFPYTEVPTGSLGQGLSVGVGMALAAKMDGLDYRTYVLLGDSEMAEGSNWEAMQLAAHHTLDTLVGIIDVNRLGQRGETMYGHDVDSYVLKCEAFGWHAIVVDGHDILAVQEAYVQAIASHKRPVMLVAKTIKGKGVHLWEDKEHWHSKQLDEDELTVALEEIGEVDLSLIGSISQPQNLAKTASPVVQQRSAFTVPDALVATKRAAGEALVPLMADYPNIVVLDAEVANSTHTEQFAQVYPEQFVQGYIMEQNMVSMAMGLAAVGKHPVANTFGAFFTRAFDQIRVLGQSALSVTLIGSYAGVSLGMDGASQMALEDIAMMRAVWNSVVLYPADAWSAYRLVQLAMDYPHLAYVRTTREPAAHVYTHDTAFEIGGSHTLRSGNDDVVTLIGAGITLHECLKAHEELATQGISSRVIDLYSIKPIDTETLVRACKETQHLIVVEDHYPEGGIAEAVRSACVYETTPIHSLAVRKLPPSGRPEELLAYEEIDASAIVAKVNMLVSKSN